VVWYDPEQAYGTAAAELSIPGTTVARYDGSFLKLRKEIDYLLNDGQPPRLVVYVPMERTETNSALIELDCAGVIMQPRQQPPACNTRLSVVARNALKLILGEDQVGEIERQVEGGKLSLADLDSLADKGKDISTGVLALIFGSANPQESPWLSSIAISTTRKSARRKPRRNCVTCCKSALTLNFPLPKPCRNGGLGWGDMSC
jgi:hypothetical protein